MDLKRRLPHFSANARTYPGLDIMRALGLFFLLCHHTELYLAQYLHHLLEDVFSRLWIFIDLFFVISGFIIADVYYNSFDRDRTSYLRRFYVSRFLKILPSYYLVLFLYHFIQPMHWSRDLTYYPYFIQNLTGIGPFVHSWSLCVEEHFYLLFPMTILGITSRRRLRVLIGILVALALFTNIYLVKMGMKFTDFDSLYAPIKGKPFPALLRYLDNFYFHTFGHLQAFSVGVGLALLKRFNPKFTAFTERYSRHLFYFGWLFLVGIITSVGERITLWSAVFALPLISIGCGILVSSSISAKATMNLKGNRFVTYIAIASYSIYLMHLIGYEFVIWVLDTTQWQIPGVIVLLFAMSSALFFGISLYEFFEKPIYKLRPRLVKRKG